jgi:hypothetical protein
MNQDSTRLAVGDKERQEVTWVPRSLLLKVKRLLTRQTSGQYQHPVSTRESIIEIRQRAGVNAHNDCKREIKVNTYWHWGKVREIAVLNEPGCVGQSHLYNSFLAFPLKFFPQSTCDTHVSLVLMKTQFQDGTSIWTTLATQSVLNNNRGELAKMLLRVIEIQIIWS